VVGPHHRITTALKFREFLGFREATVQDGNELVTRLAQHVLPHDHSEEHVREAVFERCRVLRIEPPSGGRIDRLVRSAFHSFEERWCGYRRGDSPLLYTGVRVSELVDIKLVDVDFDRCQIRINNGKGGKDRVVPFPSAFKETLALHHDRLRQRSANYLFESSWMKPYSVRGVRRLLERDATAAGLSQPISPHRLLHFLLTWLKKQGVDDALIQPYSGHASRQSVEIYSRLAIADAYADAMGRFPV
jgi:integrase/recombinase XerD